jgi:hypothetical protein
MSSTHQRRTLPAALALIALALVGLALVAATKAAADPAPDSRSTKHRTTERLVVRGEDTVKEAPCAAGLCLELTDAAFRGTVGSGAYSGAIKLKVAEGFPNGEGGLCAPVRGHIVLGAGSPDRLVLAVSGDSCQDGKGPVTSASFTGLADFVVVHGTGAYENASGSGIGSFVEDAADREHLTLIGRITR